jgi:prolyl-tRNA editing enzyme YbaK/EbsC (Cys-tRNA(Pro) deacylase)
MEESIAELPRILINAGSRGLLAEMSPAELIRVLKPVAVKVAI